MKPRQLFATLLGSAIVLASTAGIGWGLWAYKAKQQEIAKNKPPPEEVPEAVKYASVRSRLLQQTTNAVGTLVAPQWMSLRTEASGRVTNVPVTSGQQVPKDYVLLELDCSVEIAQRKAAEAKLKMANRSLNRLSSLSDTGAISSQELEQSQFDKDSAEAEIERLDAVIAKRSLRAPYDARVGLINVSVGQYLSEGFELTTLTGVGDTLYVDFAVPQTIANFIHAGQSVEVQSLGLSIPAKVIAVDARSDRMTRNLMVRAEFNIPERRLSPNDSVNVAVAYGPESKALTIPSSALLRSPSGVDVYVVVTDPKGVDRAIVRPVKVLQTIGSDVVIESGLEVGEKIISQGAFKLRPGLAVRNMDSGSESDRS